jgi:N-sulfoglucosamine sulfohydrolase
VENQGKWHAGCQWLPGRGIIPDLVKPSGTPCVYMRGMKWLFPVLLILVGGIPWLDAREDPKGPNVVWIVGEDLGPELGCYGNPDAITPNFDRLANEGARFTKCFTHAPVCAPSRHGLITGQYPIKTGAMHHRSKLVNPPVTFTKLLRDAGYFVAWPGKTDFNFDQPEDFADSKENWWMWNEVPTQPFFAYVNLGESHESQVRNDGGKYGGNTKRLAPEERRDPAKVKLPPFWPDSPDVRRELANYHDLVTAIDYRTGDILDWLDRHGIAENTIVVFFGDHGLGMPRYKRWCYDTGTHVPLIIRWPGKIGAGSVREGLVEFVDLPATMLSLAGAKVPESFDGKVFLSADGEEIDDRRYVHSARDSMDEAYDRIRSVSDGRWRYVRNFEPEIPYSLHNDYMEKGRTMQVWRQWNAEGKLDAVQSIHFRKGKPKEELYNSGADPFEVVNLADDPTHAAKIIELRAECDRWLAATEDKGAVPIEKLVADGVIRQRGKNAPRKAK